MATFIPTAEAAFIAGISDRDMNRVVDEHLVPDSLVRLSNGRKFAPLAAAFARFYFATEEMFVAVLRRKVLDELTRRVEELEERDAVLALSRLPKTMNWEIDMSYVRIDVSTFIAESLARARQLDKAESLVSSDPEVMSGAPVFAGTRVPIDTVLGSLDAGIEMSRLRRSYPFLTPEYIDAARIYAKVHPKRGRPRLSEVNPSWKVKSTRVVRPARS